MMRVKTARARGKIEKRIPAGGPKRGPKSMNPYQTINVIKIYSFIGIEMLAYDEPEHGKNESHAERVPNL